MIRHTLSTFLCFALLILAAACNSITPERYFDITVLNSNLVAGFANAGDFRTLEQPPAVLQPDQSIGVSTRKQVVDTRIQIIEDAIKKIKDLPDDHEGKPMKDAALALYEYVLPVYKNEYTALATQYDTNASAPDIDALRTSIHDKYYNQYDALYETLVTLGKSYAAKHNINVTWGS